ncbi:MAG: hypothetical protein AUK63_698 [bacterium P3]|mgnify:CR=1 FL=1|nr:MAG: hypothetical protein AUK63_698 [bacterium P3]KWW42181.1 MAG: hypothetical protein F083_520 [bacterium F083]
MRRHQHFVIVAVAILVGSTSAAAQNRPAATTLEAGSPTLSIENNNTPAEPHSPRKALLLSLLPGGGQIYNGQAWKVPVIYGCFAAAGFYMYFNYNQMKSFRDEYLLRVNGGTPALDGYTNYPDNSIYNYYQSYNQSFQLSIILSVVAYTLNLVDAYIYGHLYEFQINDDISMSLRPSLQAQPLERFMTPVPSLSCSIFF